jgi:hypothetical protein
MRAGRIRYARRDRPYAPFVPGTPAFPVITGIPPAAAITAATLANGHKTAGRTPVRRRPETSRAIFISKGKSIAHISNAFLMEFV